MPSKASRATVFFSYSRDDAAIVDAIAGVLGQVEAVRGLGFDALIDRRDLPYGEAWQHELLGMIERADAIVFVVSPRAVASNWCRWELDQVQRLSKRLVPIMISPVAYEQLPPQLGNLHVLPFPPSLDDRAGFEQAMLALAKALLSNHTWIKEHTRLGDRARQWLLKDRDRSLLLRGRALSEAEAWIDRRPAAGPAPSDDTLDLVLSSRRASGRRQRWAIGAAVAVATMAIGLSSVAYWQRGVAEQNAEQARLNAEEEQHQRVLAQEAHARFLSDRSLKATREGDASNGMLLALEAMPDPDVETSMAVVPQARQALYEAIWNRRLLAMPGQRGLETIQPQLRELLGKAIKGEYKDAKIELDKADVGTFRKLFGGIVDTTLSGHFRNSDVSADGRLVAATTLGGKVSIWNAATGETVEEFECSPVSDTAKAMEVWGKEGRWLRWMSDGTLVIQRSQRPSADGLVGWTDTTCLRFPSGALNILVTTKSGIELSDARSGKVLARLEKSQSAEAAGNSGVIADFRTARALIVDEGRVAEIWNLETGAVIGQVEKRRGKDSRLAWRRWQVSADVLCGWDGIWSMKTGQRLADFEKDRRPVNVCVPNGVTQRVATWQIDSAQNDKGKVVLWDARTGAPIAEHVVKYPTFSDPKARETALPDLEERLASLRPSFSQDGSLYWFEDLDEGTEIHDSETGQLVSVVGGTGTPQLLKAFERQSALPPGLSEETINAALGIIKKVEFVDGKAPLALGLGPRELFVVRSTTVKEKPMAQLEAWSLEQKALAQRLLEFMPSEEVVLNLIVDGNTLMVEDNTPIRELNLGFSRAWVFGREASLFDGGQSSWNVRLSLDNILAFQTLIRKARDAPVLVVQRDLGTSLAVWSTRPIGEGVTLIDAGNGREGLVTTLAFNAAGTRLAAVAGGAPRLWDVSVSVPAPVEEPKIEALSDAEGPLLLVPGLKTGENEWLPGIWDVDRNVAQPLSDALELSPRDIVSSDGKTAVVAGTDGNVEVVSIADGSVSVTLDTTTIYDKKVGVLELPEPAVTLVGLAISPDGTLIVAPSREGRSALFDGVTGKLLHQLEVPPPEALEQFGLKTPDVLLRVSLAQFSVDGKWLAGVQSAGHVMIWDATSGRLMAHLKGHTSAVTALGFSSDARFLATGSQDKTVRIWDRASGASFLVLNGHAGGVTAVAFSPDGSRIATAAIDGTVRLWSFIGDDRKLASVARDVSPFCLGERAREQNFLAKDTPAWCRTMGRSSVSALDALIEYVPPDLRMQLDVMQAAGVAKLPQQ